MIPADGPGYGELVAEVERLRALNAEMAENEKLNLRDFQILQANFAKATALNAEMLAALRSYINLFDTMANGLEVSAIELFVAREAMRDAISKSEVRP